MISILKRKQVDFLFLSTFLTIYLVKMQVQNSTLDINSLDLNLIIYPINIKINSNPYFERNFPSFDQVLSLLRQFSRHFLLLKQFSCLSLLKQFQQFGSKLDYRIGKIQINSNPNFKLNISSLGQYFLHQGKLVDIFRYLNNSVHIFVSTENNLSCTK